MRISNCRFSSNFPFSLRFLSDTPGYQFIPPVTMGCIGFQCTYNDISSGFLTGFLPAVVLSLDQHLPTLSECVLPFLWACMGITSSWTSGKKAPSYHNFPFSFPFSFTTGHAWEYIPLSFMLFDLSKFQSLNWDGSSACLHFLTLRNECYFRCLSLLHLGQPSMQGSLMFNFGGRSYVGAEQRKAILCGGLGYNFVMSQPVHGAVTAVAFLLKSINLSTLV